MLMMMKWAAVFILLNMWFVHVRQQRQQSVCVSVSVCLTVRRIPDNAKSNVAQDHCSSGHPCDPNKQVQGQKVDGWMDGQYLSPPPLSFSLLSSPLPSSLLSSLLSFPLLSSLFTFPLLSHLLSYSILPSPLFLSPIHSSSSPLLCPLLLSYCLLSSLLSFPLLFPFLCPPFSPLSSLCYTFLLFSSTLLFPLLSSSLLFSSISLLPSPPPACIPSVADEHCCCFWGSSGTEQPFRAPLEPAVCSCWNVRYGDSRTEISQAELLSSVTHRWIKDRKWEVTAAEMHLKYYFDFNFDLSIYRLEFTFKLNSAFSWAMGCQSVGFTSVPHCSRLAHRRMTPAGTAMTQTAQNPPIVLVKKASFLAFSERSGRLWPFSRHVMDYLFVDGFWSGSGLTLLSVSTHFSGRIYLCGDTAAISGLTHSCFRKDRLAQFSSASPRRSDSHKQSAARAVHRT